MVTVRRMKLKTTSPRLGLKSEELKMPILVVRNHLHYQLPLGCAVAAAKVHRLMRYSRCQEQRAPSELVSVPTILDSHDIHRNTRKSPPKVRRAATRGRSLQRRNWSLRTTICMDEY